MEKQENVVGSLCSGSVLRCRQLSHPAKDTPVATLIIPFNRQQESAERGGVLHKMVSPVPFYIFGPYPPFRGHKNRDLFRSDIASSKSDR